MKDLYIAGAGGFAREVAFLVEEINRVQPTWQLRGFTEEDRANVGKSVGKYQIIGAHGDLLDKSAAVVIAIGQPAVILRLRGVFSQAAGLEFPNLAHPNVVWDRDQIAIGVGNIVCAGCILTTDLRIGSFNIFNLAGTFGHDMTIGDCCVFSPGAHLSGGVRVGDRCFVGTGACVMPQLELAEGAVVGGGAVVTRDVAQGTTVGGVPAKPLVRSARVGRRPKLCVVAAAPSTLKTFMIKHLEAMAGLGEVTIVANFTQQDADFAWPAGVTPVPVAIARPIAPWADLMALLALHRLFRQQQFDLVHSLTPKAGLLSALAGWLARVPLRLHTFTGQVWATRTGISRVILRAADKVTAGLTTDVLADSASQRAFLIKQGVVPAAKVAVLAQGSLGGVDPTRFAPNRQARARIRESLAIPENSIVFVYLGRLQRDKGVLDLARAFAAVGVRLPIAHLLVVGRDEGQLLAELGSAAGDCRGRLHCVGSSDQPQDYLAAADVLCLPSYREGFPTVLLEAAATGLPAIGSRIYGITDAIVEHETGLLFSAGAVSQLADHMLVLAGDADFRARLGHAARERVLRGFSASAATAAWLHYHRGILAQLGTGKSPVIEWT